MKKFTSIITIFAMVGLLFGSFQPASADQDPPGCNSNDFVLNLGKSVSIGYDETSPFGASTVTYTVSTGNPNTSGSGCNVDDVDVNLTTPDGVVHNLQTGGSYPIGTSVSILGTVDYTINSSNIVGNSVTAQVNATGDLHDVVGAGTHSNLEISKNIQVLVIHPSTITTITSSETTVYAGDTVTLTVTEENDGDVDLTGAYVAVDNGVGNLTAPPTAGDDGDGVLEPTEVWSWTVNGVVINSDTTFTANGHGIDLLQNDISEANGFLTEEDSVLVDVINPTTVTSASVDMAVVVLGDGIVLTITEHNDGDVDLTDPHVILNPGNITLDETSPDFDGVDGVDLGVLDPGETWTWTLNYNPSTNTTYVATGHGTDPLGNDVTWCEDPQNPPQGVVCDQDERDSVDVRVVEELVIEKTAVTSYDREWDWTINKSADQTSLLLQENESFDVNYEITVASTPEDINHVVSGTITITNPVGNAAATITGVTDALNSSGATVVTCPGAFPQQLAGGSSLICTYTKNVTGKTDTLNTVTVTTTGDVPGGSAMANVVWGAPANLIDECIVVDDTYAGGPQDMVVCFDDADKTFNYTVTFGPAGGEGVEVPVACGTTTHPNIASFTTQDDANDTDEAGSDNWNVTVTVECVQGCTLTMGYWKTHNDSFKGGAPTDDTWFELPSAELSGFFITSTSTYPTSSYPTLGPNSSSLSSPFTWFSVFWTAPKGNAYYQLAHQYMAAKLNMLAGASAPASVTTAITAAENFFDSYTPSAFYALGKKDQLRKDVIMWAGILGSYNEGFIGPGHCDEQNPES